MVLQAMKASGVSVYLNCEDLSYVGRHYQATIDRLSDNIVDSVDDSRYMYSTFMYIIVYDCSLKV